MSSFQRLVLAATCVAAAIPAAAQAHRWRPLFNGRTLDGWTPKISRHALGDNYRNTFIVRNRAIRVSYQRYDKFADQFGHLFYRVPFAAYRIRFKYRFYGDYMVDTAGWQHSNSGLMFAAQPPATMARDQKFPVSIEMQLLGKDSDAPRSTGNVCTPGTNIMMRGKLETRHCMNSSSETVPVGQWVKAELDVRPDSMVIHLINGQEVLRYSHPQLDPRDADAQPLISKAGGRLGLNGGYIALQSEGHPIEFKDIEILEYKAPRGAGAR